MRLTQEQANALRCALGATYHHVIIERAKTVAKEDA